MISTMNTKKFSKRKAISPILATVILIAITLIAAVAIAGFVFGLFGSFTSTAQISISSETCSVGGSQCTIYFLNTGTSTGSVSGASINYGGLGYTALTCTPATQTVVAGGEAASISCIPATTFVGAVVGQAFTLEATASSGSQPLGAGSFSA